MRSSIAFAVLALCASSVSAQVGASQRARRSYQPENELERRQIGASQRARRSFTDDDSLDRRQVGGASQRARRSVVLSEDKPRRCPASHSICIVAGSLRGFECVDTSVRYFRPRASRSTMLTRSPSRSRPLSSAVVVRVTEESSELTFRQKMIPAPVLTTLAAAPRSRESRPSAVFR